MRSTLSVADLARFGATAATRVDGQHVQANSRSLRHNAVLDNGTVWAMDPVTLGVITKVVGEMVTKATAALLRETGRDTFEIESVSGDYLIGDLAEGGDSVALTEPQLRDIAAFLSGPAVAGLTQAYYLSYVAGQLQEDAFEVRVGRGFARAAIHWCSKGSVSDWSSAASLLWTRVVESILAAAPPLGVLNSVSQQERDELQRLAEPVLLMGRGPTPPAHVRSMLAVASDQWRLKRSREVVDDIRRALPASTNMRMQHTRDEQKFDYARLYIERHLMRRSDGRSASSAEVLATRERAVRAVVVGDPGVGKSTLVRHLVLQPTSDADDDRPVPIVLLCKEYAPERNDSLTKALRATIDTELNVTVSEAELEDVLSLGRLFVVFDGVDEIGDLGRRSRFVTRAQTFAARYPGTSILVTSRLVGYERASFDRTHFVDYSLLPFSEQQVREYASRWFQLTERSNLDRDHFLQELTTVQDIKNSPLLLSLLCTLYGSRGYIPRNRLEVYKECADLLFHRWDSIRHIDQPYDHTQYGQILMRDLARFFYNSSSASPGVEEQQLGKLIAAYFEGTSAVDSATAAQRAKNFLDFCADRAWLLTSEGRNDRGQRVFRFTHRTFLEYYAAEAIVWEAETLPPLVDSVAAAYERDPSSVMPEVIVQCAEGKWRNGAATILSGLLVRGAKATARGKYTPLCLRILNSAPVNASVTRDVLEEVFASWERGRDTNAVDLLTNALAVLYRDPRSLFMDLIREEMQGEMLSRRAADFLWHWAKASLRGQTAIYEDDWGPFISEVSQHIIRHARQLKSPIIVNLLLERGEIDVRSVPMPMLTSGALFALDLEGDYEAGAALLAYHRLVANDALQDSARRARDIRLLAALVDVLPKGTMERRKASAVYNLLESTSMPLRREDYLSGQHTPDVADLLRRVSLWLACAIYESDSVLCGFLAELGNHGLLDVEQFSRLAVTRNSALGLHDDELAPSFERYNRDELTRSVSSDWLRKWARGTHVLAT